MRLTDRELKLFLGALKAKRMYRGMDIPLGAKVWEPWMEDTIRKIEDELLWVLGSDTSWN